MQSSNCTFFGNKKIQHHTLKSGDSFVVSKHTTYFSYKSPLERSTSLPLILLFPACSLFGLADFEPDSQ
ncbi:hypothetical protein [Candidatus Uabimicrobium amorphum]|uniref:hypothetical protein n=1 Tax=Uabimicrobium amorphum TaxID=2596890 RepID=UPI0034A5832B